MDDAIGSEGRARKAGWWVLRLVVAALLLGALYLWVDWSALREVATRLSLPVVALVLLGGTGSRLVCTIRWNVVAGGLMQPPPGIVHLFRAGLLAEFVNLWVPSSFGGEAARIWRVSKVSDVPRATLSVGVDRVLGVCGLTLSLLPVPLLVELPLPGWVVPASVAAVLVAVGIGLALRDRVAGLAPWAGALAGLSLARVVTALALSTLAPWCIVAGYVVFFGAVHPLPLGEVAAFLLLTRFGRAVPVSLFGVNSVEGSMLVLGELFGIPNAIVALAVAMNFTDKLVHSVLGGVVELAANGREGMRALAAPGE